VNDWDGDMSIAAPWVLLFVSERSGWSTQGSGRGVVSSPGGSGQGSAAKRILK